jgi:hypothetical protein
MELSLAVMDRLVDSGFTGSQEVHCSSSRRLIVSTRTTTTAAPAPTALVDLDDVCTAIAKRSYCTLASTSPAGHPHAAGVLYAADGTTLYVSTLRTSRKARNIDSNPRVGVVIPVRRLPVGPPSAVQFQGHADILATDDPVILELAAAGTLKGITGHGELHLPGGCFLRITPVRMIHTYGLGMSLRRLIKDPLNAGSSVSLPG